MSDKKKWNTCAKCKKTLASYKSLWQHKKKCKFNDANRQSKVNVADPPFYQPRDQEKIVEDILNNVSQRANMNVEPMTNKVPLKKLMNQTVQKVPNISDSEMTDLDSESELDENESTASESEENHENKTNDNDSTDSESEDNSENMKNENRSTDSELDSIPDNPEDMKKCFRILFNELHYNIDRNVDIYNKLVFMLDELDTMNCLTEEESNAMNKCLSDKMRI